MPASLTRALPALLLAWHATAAPNVLFIVTDDQRPELPGAALPHLDRLAASGARLTRAYAGYPICFASRAEMLTGRPAFTALKNYPASGVDPAHTPLPAAFAAAGYETWHLGKWHVSGQPRDHGYARVHRHFSSGGARDAPLPEKDARGLPLTGYRGWTFKNADGSAARELGIGLTPATSRHIADGALEVLESLRDPAKPFFLHVNFTAPHDPRLWPEGYDAARIGGRVPLPPNFAPQHPFDHGNLNGRDETLIPRPLDPAQVRAELAVYHALVRDLDDQLGRLLAALDRLGLRQDTIVIFTSDQGLAMGAHGLMGKQNQYEHSIRSPLVLAGPGVPGAFESAALCHLRDLYPTLCELCAIPVPDSVQARSLLPLLRGEVAELHPFVIGAFTGAQRMICDARWKWIEYPQAGRRQLFDLQNDPHELRDLSAEPAQQTRVQTLAARLRVALRGMGDPLPLPD